MGALYALAVFSTVLIAAAGVPFEIKDEDLLSLPELFTMENYERCMMQTESVYCFGTFKLSSEGPSELMDLLTRYSENTLENYNRTKIERGVCLGPNRPCQLQDGANWNESFFSCVQKEMDRYGLRAKIMEHTYYCRNRNTGRQMDVYDYSFIYYAMILISINVAATVYDVFKGAKANPWIVSFSIIRNWQRLIGFEEVPEEFQTFQCLHGFKGLLSTFVILAHVPLGQFMFPANPRHVEMIGHKPYSIFLYNGTVIIQLFMLISAFLRAYHMTVFVNKGGRLSFDAVFKAVVDRIVRIGPLYFTTVWFTATIAVYTGAGALWPRHIEGQADTCREMFWVQMLWLQNMFPPKCVPQAWYLSIDMQFCIICTALMVFLHKRSDKLAILSRMFAASIVLLFAIVYALELQPSLFFVNPESVLTLFSEQRSFHLLYQSIWGNLPTTLMGMIAGIAFFNMQQTNYNPLKGNKLFKILFNGAIPIALVYIGSGWLFLGMRSRLSVSLYATLVQPLFAFVIGAVLLFGCVCKVDAGARYLFEWRGWEPLGRLSLASLLIHGGVSRAMACANIHPLTVSVGGIFSEWFSIAIVTYALSVPACILIEFPFINIWKAYYKKDLAKLDSNGNATTESNGAKLDSNGNGHAKFDSNRAKLDSNGNGHAKFDSNRAKLDSNGNGHAKFDSIRAKFDSNGNGHSVSSNGHSKTESNGCGLSKNGHAKVQ